MRLFILLLCSFLISCVHNQPFQHRQIVSDSKQLSMIQTYLVLEKWELAKTHLDQVPDVSRDVYYWRLLSLYWLLTGREEKALSVHENALVMYPNDGFILNNYGVLLGQKKQWSEACKAFSAADKNDSLIRQSVQINLARCAIRQNDVNLASIYLKQAKEIDDLSLIGLMTELNLVLIQGRKNKARIIFNNIQAGKKIARDSVHFDEYNCLSRYLIARETDPTLYPSASNFTCLNGSR